MEGKVRDDAERLARERDGGGVGLDDVYVRPASTEPVGEPGIELDRDDPPRAPRELAGEPACTCAEIDDEVVLTNGRVANELRRDCAAKKVLATRAGRPRTTRGPACHGT